MELRMHADEHNDSENAKSKPLDHESNLEGRAPDVRRPG
jgi:hypothetical protein